MEDMELASKTEAYSIAGACEASGIKQSSIFEEIRAGNLKARKFGRRTIILRDDLLAWLHAFPIK